MKLILEIEGPQAVLEEVYTLNDLRELIMGPKADKTLGRYSCTTRIKHVFDAQEGANVGQGQSSNGS